MYGIERNLPLAIALCLFCLAWGAGCNRHPEQLNIVDFGPYSNGKRWNPSDLFTEPSAIALAEAVKHGNVKEIDRLISAGSDVNSHGLDEITPLGWALIVKQKAAFTRLLERGADPNTMVWGHVPLLEIAAGDETDSEWLRRLLEYKADPNIVNRIEEGFNGRKTPIYSALLSKRQENVDLLIEAGANLNYQDYLGATPLYFASYMVGFQSAFHLLEAGADFRIKDKVGRDLAYRVIYAQPSFSTTDDAWKWRQKIIDFLEAHDADFTDAEAKAAKDIPEDLRTWLKEKQRRAAQGNAPLDAGENGNGEPRLVP